MDLDDVFPEIFYAFLHSDRNKERKENNNIFFFIDVDSKPFYYANTCIYVLQYFLHQKYDNLMHIGNK